MCEATFPPIPPQHWLLPIRLIRHEVTPFKNPFRSKAVDNRSIVHGPCALDGNSIRQRFLSSSIPFDTSRTGSSTALDCHEPLPSLQSLRATTLRPSRYNHPSRR